MKDLLQISTSTIGTEQVNSVNIKELVAAIDVKTHASQWFQRQVDKYNFIENEDFISISQKSEIGNKPLVDYIVTLDTAKELAMVANTQKGREVRKYFIEVEKNQRQTVLPSTKELALMVVRAEEEKEQLQIENKKKSEFISNVVHSQNTYTATQVAKDFNISAKLFNKILVEADVLYYQNGTYALTSRYQSFNLTTIKETNPDANDKTYLSLRWTVAGKNWLKNNWEKALQKCSSETFDQYNQMFLKNLPSIPMPKKSERNF